MMHKKAAFSLIVCVLIFFTSENIYSQSSSSAATLIKGIQSSSKTTRKISTQELVWHFKQDQNAINMALSLLEPPTENDLSAASRINALYYLSSTTPEAWTKNMLDRARSIVPGLRQKHASKPQTSGLIAKFNNHLANATPRFKSITQTPVVQDPDPRPIKAGKYHALIIGIADYQHSSLKDLREPVKDARKIKQILATQYTFAPNNIRFLTNPTRTDIIDEFDRLTSTLSEQDNLLIFYSGHGHWDQQINQGYWLPSDARESSRANWLSNGDIRDYINGIKTRHTLLISDACFSGGIFQTKRAFYNAHKATNTLYSLPSRKAITSGTRNEEVPDKSVFLQYLSKRLTDNNKEYIASFDLFSRFKEAVINNSKTQQVPQYGVIRESGDEGGDFIFIKRR